MHRHVLDSPLQRLPVDVPGEPGLRQLPAGNVPHAVVTFAAKVCPPPGMTIVDAGEMATLSTRSGATFTVTEATLPPSA